MCNKYLVEYLIERVEDVTESHKLYTVHYILKSSSIT